ncbi:adenosylcobyric acid synthase [Parabacteroides sp. PF5-5]|uniref:cobyric acid synthase n=1 Tax=unclassified Parabacteroides TaxID=2649774 RepID=UPI00247658DA|nr:MULTISPECIES: cobyric acid synthase [unclassified Parabacteroides]MDH6305853.1 adenosylcobyric acid synthase [Parabacteroides sp. PH5-39]MDH6317333.1 adenosylcobyric acid synthase [Parabacteroides sp. PF5-13]MDH6320541.1 adenosylcobyric acid synthase [Parabacteroides sp. PH5-13]MDH6324296.1 adenosylcobyric acid synthase [Parabacteroides sp. PH5-8]MDH6328493.1 adenosylcobyric acid synthase [Parabacteroides sp. PH5-41]
MIQRLRPIMFVGTCSDAGKSVIAAAFCRIFKQDGYTPAPFKAQNMSLNSYSTPEGGEMGRAQVVQAEAAGIAPHTDMNPVLLKPNHDTNSQVVLHGKPVGNMSAKDYFGKENPKEALFQEVRKAFKRLEKQYNPIVMEGAGSISELNLRDRDITNMRMALAAGANTYLIADIDRGGVFGSVYGTIALLPPEEKALIKGIIINKFRGDISLFDDGKKILEELTGVPVVGIIPYFRDIKIEEEDAVALDMKNNTWCEGKINVAIILLRRMSNFTDFDVLEMDPRFNPYYTHDIQEIEKADIIILPGSKNTLSDLQTLRENGIADAIVKAYKNGKKVIGVCGGYQMMGVQLEDPDGVEGDILLMPGLGLLPLKTVLEKEKVTRQSQFVFLPNAADTPCKGYEIHMGQTSLMDGAESKPLVKQANGNTDGYYLNQNCWGSYIHGIFDNSVVLDHLDKEFTPSEVSSSFDYTAFKNEQYDKLASLVRAHVNMEEVYKQLL